MNADESTATSYSAMLAKKVADSSFWCRIVGHRHQFEDLTSESEPALEITCARDRCEYQVIHYGTEATV